jgi:hypothetical protein
VAIPCQVPLLDFGVRERDSWHQDYQNIFISDIDGRAVSFKLLAVVIACFGDGLRKYQLFSFVSGSGFKHSCHI